MKISTMLPFLEEEEIDSLIEEILYEKVDLKLYQILPFVSEEKIDYLIDRSFNDDSITVRLKHLLPFVNERQMEVLYEAFKDGTIKSSCDFSEGEMLPYLAREKIKTIFEEQLKKMKLEIKENIKNAFDEIKKEPE